MIRKQLINTENEDVVWQAWGGKQLKRLMAVPADFAKKTYVVDIDGELIVQIEKSGTENGLIRVLRLKPTIFYGFGTTVNRRCFCRRLTAAVLNNTSLVSVGTPFNGNPWTYTPATTQGLLDLANSASNYFGSDSSPELVRTLVYTVNLVDLTTRAFISTFTGTWTRATYGDVRVFLSDINDFLTPISDSIRANNQAIYTTRDETNSALFAAAQAAADAENEARLAESMPVLNIVLTDGTVLASRALVDAGSDGSFFQPVAAFPWFGGNDIPVFNFDFDNDQLYTVSEYIPLDLPDDVCFVPLNLDLIDFDIVVPAQRAALREYAEASQIIGKAREITRRQRCSVSSLTMMRNGVLPPEFNMAATQSRQLSARLKRQIPLNVVSDVLSVTSNTTFALNERPDKVTRIRVIQRDIMLRYQIQVPAGEGEFEPLDIDIRLIGQVTETTTSHVDIVSEFFAGTSVKYEYQDFPAFRATAEDLGASFPANSSTLISGLDLAQVTRPLGNNNYIDVYNSSLYIDDAVVEPLNINSVVLVQLNGINTTSVQVPDDQYGVPFYTAAQVIPPLPPTTSSVTLTIPDGIRTYFERSPAIESELVDGVITPVTPNRDWLFSAFREGDTVNIVPLIRVGLDDAVLGMYPLEHTDEDNNTLIKELHVVGYGTYAYSNNGNTLRPLRWTEIVQSLDDPTAVVAINIDENTNFKYLPEPTEETPLPTPAQLEITITVNGEPQTRTYTLSKKVIPWRNGYENTTCVYIRDDHRWSDLKIAAREQKSRLTANFQEDEEVLSDADRLYFQIKNIVFSGA